MERGAIMAQLKKMADYFNRRETEVGEVLGGEKVYLLGEGFDILHETVYKLYDLDDSEWNDDLIYLYLFGAKSLEHFERFAVPSGGSYDGLMGINDRVWRELTVFKGGNSSE